MPIAEGAKSNKTGVPKYFETLKSMNSTIEIFKNTKD